MWQVSRVSLDRQEGLVGYGGRSKRAMEEFALRD